MTSVDIGRYIVCTAFPYISSHYCIPVAFSFYVPRERTVSRACNKPHSVSLLSSLSLSLALLPSLWRSTICRERKTNTFPRGCVLKKRASNEKAAPMRKLVRGMRSSKYHLDPSIIVPSSLCSASPRHPFRQNRLVNPFEWLSSDIFCLASPLHSFRDFSSSVS